MARARRPRVAIAVTKEANVHPPSEDPRKLAGPEGEPPVLGEYDGFEIYPMPAFAMLAVDQPAALSAWYEAALGFGVVFAGPPPHLRRRKYQDLLLVPAGPGAVPAGGGPVLYFDADGEIDALAARAAAVPAQGRSALEGPRDTPWNTRELRVTDPAGHRLVFSARRPTPDPEAAARWQEAFAAGRRPG